MNQPIPRNIDIDSCPRILCHVCGNKYFRQIWEVRHVSKIIMPPNGGKVNMQLYSCESCGSVIDLDNPVLEKEEWTHTAKNAESKSITTDLSATSAKKKK